MANEPSPLETQFICEKFADMGHLRELTALQKTSNDEWRLVHQAHSAILAIPLGRQELMALRAAIDVTLATPP
jgi:hypothetical protein